MQFIKLIHCFYNEKILQVFSKQEIIKAVLYVRAYHGQSFTPSKRMAKHIEKRL